MTELAWTLSDGLLAGGTALILLAALILWRTSRYDLKGAAIESAIDVARGRRSAENPTAIERKLGEIAAEASVTGKAKRAAGTVIGHVLAQVLGVAALVMLGVGGLMLAAGFYWR